MIRVNVAAAIVRKNQILVIEYDDESGLHYNLPGGGVEDGELLTEALQREVREEAGVEIEPGPLLITWEYEPARENFRYGTQQKIGLIYAADLKPGQEPDLSHRYDSYQTGVSWLPLEQVSQVETINLFGARLLDALRLLKN